MSDLTSHLRTGRLRRRNDSVGLSWVDNSTKIVHLHNRLNGMLGVELTRIDLERSRTSNSISLAQRQVMRRFTDCSVRSAYEQARLSGDRDVELKLVRRLQSAATNDVRRLDADLYTLTATDSPAFQKIISGELRLKRFVDVLVDEMGTGSRIPLAVHVVNDFGREPTAVGRSTTQDRINQ